MEPQKITWVQTSNGAHNEYAVPAGIDTGRKVYVVRARHRGGMIPGKLHKGARVASIPYGGREIGKDHYEVLISPPGSLSWVDAEGSNIPNHSIRGGNDPGGDVYYVGRVCHNGTVTVGKVHGGTCFISYGGKEHAYRKYEILVRNAYGRALDV